MKHTADKIKTQVTQLPSLLKVFSMFIMSLRYDNENLEDHVMDNIGVRCNNCGEKLVYQ